MKKIICLLLAVCTALMFAACGKPSAKDDNSDTVDLEYYIKLGKMPESKYDLGASFEDIKAAADEEAEEPLTLSAPDRTGINYQNFNYYYDDIDSEKKISYIVSFAGAYGYTQGTLSEKIKSDLSKRDLNAKEEALTEDETFFIPIKGEFTGIKYTFSDSSMDGVNTVCFVFENGALCAAALYHGVTAAD